MRRASRDPCAGGAGGAGGARDTALAGGTLLGLYAGAVRAIPRRAGDATVHPSSLLHGVSRVLPAAGTRYTLIVFFR